MAHSSPSALLCPKPAQNIKLIFLFNSNLKDMSFLLVKITKPKVLLKSTHAQHTQTYQSKKRKLQVDYLNIAFKFKYFAFLSDLKYFAMKATIIYK